jgi:hypothetical protein
METVAGQEAYLMTVGDRLKVYRAPALNGEDLKVIFLLNGKPSTIFEPVSVTVLLCDHFAKGLSQQKSAFSVFFA